MIPRSARLTFALLGALLLASGPALAERADKEKPINLEADKVTVDDIKGVQILEGNVILTQGTMMIHADRIVVTEDQYGFHHGTAFGGPNGLAHFRQKRDDSDAWIEGEAERIEYDTRTEVAELFHRAWVKNGEDQIHGDYIWYDATSQRYLATKGDTGLKQPTRVRAMIQPKKKGTPPAETASQPSNLQLKGAESITPPEHP